MEPYGAPWLQLVASGRKTSPVVLGAGKRLFPEGTTPTGLRLTHSQTTEKGVAILSYERAGKPTYGTVGVDT
jgi:hypothetical protein